MTDFLKLSGIGCAALVTVATRYGFGLHLQTISNLADREEAIKYNLIAPCLAIVSSTLSKVSMVVFCLQLLGRSATKLHRWFIFSVLAAMIVLNIFIVVILIAFCKPVEKAWRPQIEGTCLPGGVMSTGGRFQSGEETPFYLYLIGILNVDSSMECADGPGHGGVSGICDS
jgi:hypothetical protein